MGTAHPRSVEEARGHAQLVLARRMIRAIKAAGLSEQEAARLSGVSYATMNHYLNGKYAPDAITLAWFAAACGTTVARLIGGAQDHGPATLAAA